MKEQIEILKKLQERVLIRDGFGAFAGMDGSMKIVLEIGELEKKLDGGVWALYDVLVRHNNVFIAPLVGHVCAGCGMVIPTSNEQEVRLGQKICCCTHCGRILYVEPEDVVKGLMPKRKKQTSPATLARFSCEDLVVPNIKAADAEGAIAELAAVMAKKGFVSDDKGLVAAATAREGVLPTSMPEGLAFPHVRGVEGGQLTLAIGRSARGIDWGGRKVNYVFLAAIPVAASNFYSRLVIGILEAFRDGKKRGWVDTTASEKVALWKAVLKATRVTTK